MYMVCDKLPKHQVPVSHDTEESIRQTAIDKCFLGSTFDNNLPSLKIL